MYMNNGTWVCSLAKAPVYAANCSVTFVPAERRLCSMCAAFHLSPKALFDVDVGRGGEGVIEEDESVSLHIEGQVGTRGEDIILSIPCVQRAIVSHVENTQP